MDDIAIQLFEGKKVRCVWDEEKEKYYFAVVEMKRNRRLWWR